MYYLKCKIITIGIATESIEAQVSAGLPLLSLIIPAIIPPMMPPISNNVDRLALSCSSYSAD